MNGVHKNIKEHNIDNNKKCFLVSKFVLEWFLEDHMTEDWRNDAENAWKCEYNIFDEYVSNEVEEQNKQNYIECIVNNHAQS